MNAHFRPETWLTPKPLIDALGPFDLDPCAAPEPRPWPTAGTMWSLPAQDGLALPWFGRVWLNPPYGRETRRWLARLADHGSGIALVAARVETRWFQEEVWLKAHAVLFPRGRVRFCTENGTPARKTPFPSCFVAYSALDAWRLQGPAIRGIWVPLRRVP